MWEMLWFRGCVLKCPGFSKWEIQRCALWKSVIREIIRWSCARSAVNLMEIKCIKGRSTLVSFQDIITVLLQAVFWGRGMPHLYSTWCLAYFHYETLKILEIQMHNGGASISNNKMASSSLSDYWQIKKNKYKAKLKDLKRLVTSQLDKISPFSCKFCFYQWSHVCYTQVFGNFYYLL